MSLERKDVGEGKERTKKKGSLLLSRHSFRRLAKVEIREVVTHKRSPDALRKLVAQ